MRVATMTAADSFQKKQKRIEWKSCAEKQSCAENHSGGFLRFFCALWQERKGVSPAVYRHGTGEDTIKHPHKKRRKCMKQKKPQKRELKLLVVALALMIDRVY